MVKKLFVACIALTTTSISAFAADLPSRAAPPVFVPPPVPVFTWTGFYVGGNAGYTETTRNNVSIAASGAPIPGAAGAGIPTNNGFLGALQSLGGIPNNASAKRSGFIGGGQIGYNYQINSIVLGVEADIQGVPNSGSTSTINATPVFPGGAGGAAIGALFQSQSTISRRIDYIGTVRGRVGFAFDRFFVYGTGGLAYGQTRLSYGINFPGIAAIGAIGGGGAAANISGSNSSSKTSVGYAAGGGIEYAINQNWSIKAEGLYYDLGRQSVTTNVNFTGLGVGGLGNRTERVTASVRNEGFIARGGVNYRFAFDPAPVVARY